MDNIEKISASLVNFGLDGVLVTGESNRLYATGFAASDGVCVITREKSYFITDSRYIEAAENAVKGAVVLAAADGDKSFKQINEILKRHGVEKLGYEEKVMTCFKYRVYEENLCAGLCPAQALFVSLRSRKSREELDNIIAAQRIAERSLREIIPMISTDITEKELAAELLYRMLRNGAQDKSFDTIVVSGARSSMPHGVPGDGKLAKGFLTIDFGAKVAGYCSDMTRTFCIGRPTEEMKKVYETVLAAQLAGIDAARGGVSGSEIDMAARRVIEKAGYGKNFGHAFGHSLGIDIHESPVASPFSGSVIPEGAVISAEPGIYIPGKFGVRIEDVLYITEDGCENITNMEKQLTII